MNSTVKALKQRSNFRNNKDIRIQKGDETNICYFKQDW